MIEKLQDANNAVSKRMECDKSFLSKGVRVLTDISTMSQPIVQAFPDQLCILHGGLSLLFHVSGSIKQTIVFSEL